MYPKLNLEVLNENDEIFEKVKIFLPGQNPVPNDPNGTTTVKGIQDRIDRMEKINLNFEINELLKKYQK